MKPKQQEHNVWKMATIFLAIICGIILVSQIIDQKKLDTEYSLVDKLILNKILFVYSSGCPACESQIEIFGLHWNKYINSGLTLDCATQSSYICQQVRVTPSWVYINETETFIVGEGVING
jgi:hypothetical protein